MSYGHLVKDLLVEGHKYKYFDLLGLTDDRYGQSHFPSELPPTEKLLKLIVPSHVCVLNKSQDEIIANKSSNGFQSVFPFRCVIFSKPPFVTAMSFT